LLFAGVGDGSFDSVLRASVGRRDRNQSANLREREALVESFTMVDNYGFADAEGITLF
jgi:hypothetical protein